MILDTAKFIRDETPSWKELEELLSKIEQSPDGKMSLETAKRLHYLYEKVSEDLVRISTLSGEREIRRYLESLVARTYSHVHRRKRKIWGFSFRNWMLRTFPRTFRKNVSAFYISVLVTVLGFSFGGAAVYLDPEAKDAIFPKSFGHLLMSPEDRVNMEEKEGKNKFLEERQASFAAALIENNISVSINAFALGLSFGVGTILLLFYNGIILGAVFLDYFAAGQSEFLLGWLLPHGVIEIPAILIAGQAGIVLGRIILMPQSAGRLESLRLYANDLVTLICGCAVLLVWAGIVESFLSQYHWPVIPYIAKIIFGLLELAALAVYLSMAGRAQEPGGKAEGRR